MRYSGLIKNDVVNGEGVCVSFWTQGCPHKCPDCFNPETWDYNGGMDIPKDIEEQILNAIPANGIQRNFSILGGEPLCPENQIITERLCFIVKKTFPTIKIFIWTGYEFEDVKKLSSTDFLVNSILKKSDVIISGPYIQEKRDLTLKLRGSSNQQIWRKINNKWIEVY